MKKLLSRSLIGAAVFVACGATHAATVTRTTNYSSIEANAAAAATNGAASVTLPALRFNLAGTGYVDGDIITVSFSGGSLRLGSVGTVDVQTVVCTGEKEVGGAAAAANAFTLTVKSVSANQVTYAVSGRDPAVVVGGRTTGVPLAATQCILKGPGAIDFDMLASSLTAGSAVTVNWSAATASGVVHDTLTDTEGNPATARTIHVADTQFGMRTSTARPTTQRILGRSDSTLGLPAGFLWANTAPTSAVTGASTGLRASTGWAASTSVTHRVTATDHLYNAALGVTQVGRLTTTDTVVITYTGNFGFLDNDNNGCTLSDLGRGNSTVAIAGGGGTFASVAADCSSISTTGALRTEDLTFSVAQGVLGTNGAKAIPVGTISASASFRAGTTVLGSAALSTYASWTSDAQSADIAYMPYGAGISRIVYVTNNSVSSPVTITAVAENGTSCASTRFPAVTATAGRVTLLSAAMDAGIEACLGAGYTGKVKFTVALNVPSAAQYSVQIGEQTLTPRDAAAADGTRAASATIGAAGNTGATIAPVSGQISRINEPFEIYSAYNVNGNRITVTNSTNGR